MGYRAPVTAPASRGGWFPTPMAGRDCRSATAARPALPPRQAVRPAPRTAGRPGRRPARRGRRPRGPESDQFVEGGHSYDWYQEGWNGPGFYVVGSAFRQGIGFGGGEGGSAAIITSAAPTIIAADCATRPSIVASTATMTATMTAITIATIATITITIKMGAAATEAITMPAIAMARITAQATVNTAMAATRGSRASITERHRRRDDETGRSAGEGLAIPAPVLIGWGVMPLQFKLPGYLGNAILLLLGLVTLASENAIVGALLAALAALNLYLVYKLDQFSRQEVWLAHQVEVAKMREELLVAQRRVAELQAAGSNAGPGKQDDVTMH